jgi:Uma2 family endonuclease
MSAANQLPDLMTVAEFLVWETPDGSNRWELVEGAPEAMAPSSPRHGAIAARVARLLDQHLDGHPRCRVIAEPGVRPRVRGRLNVRIPDIGVTCSPSEPEDRLLREPVVLVEILSPSNPKDTWANVWSYTSIPSVREILVLHTAQLRADLLARSADGTWPEDPATLEAADTVVLESIGFSAPLAAFYRTAGIAIGTAGDARR